VRDDSPHKNIKTHKHTYTHTYVHTYLRMASSTHICIIIIGVVSMYLVCILCIIVSIIVIHVTDDTYLRMASSSACRAL
jgi:hypothetical protein